MKSQSLTVKRIEEICKEFDDRVKKVGVPIARLELAKALALAESRSVFFPAHEKDQSFGQLINELNSASDLPKCPKCKGTGAQA